MLLPGPSDELLSSVLRELMLPAADAQGIHPGLQHVANFLQASRAQLVAHGEASRFPAGTIHAFDLGIGDEWLRQALAAANGDQGICTVLRHQHGQADVLVLSRRGVPFGEVERRWLELLLPHLQLALELADCASSPLPTMQAASSMTHVMPMPCLLTDDTGRCLERNADLDKALRTLNGTIRAGRISFADAFLDTSWRQALKESHITAQTQLLLANGSSSWKVHVVPFSCMHGPARSAARHLSMVFFERSTGSAMQHRTVPASRPLTKAELEVLANLLLGHTAKVIARARGASVHTVRSQITSILGKTGHQTQKELIASIGASSFGSELSDMDDDFQ